MGKTPSVKVLANNKKAYHDYFVEETLEAGVSLVGTEVKSIRLGRLNLKDSYCSVKNGEMILQGLHISPYEKGNIFNKDPLRERKLLLHRQQIDRLFGKVKQDGYALVPLRVYLKGAYVKVEIGLCKGKKLYDKRESAAKASATRDMQRSMRIEKR